LHCIDHPIPIAMASSNTDSRQEEQMATNKKAKHDFLGMLDDKLVLFILFFAGGNAKDLVQIQRVNKSCRNLLRNDHLMMYIHYHLNAMYGHGLQRQWDGQNFPGSLECLGFYQAVHQNEILNPQAFCQQGRHAVPQAALHMQALFELMNKFPQCKTSWEGAAASLGGHQNQDSKNLLGIAGGGMVSDIINYMILKGIISNPNNAGIDINEHFNINMFGRRKKYQHSIYDEYRAKIPANLFQSGMEPEMVEVFWNRLPLHLKYLIVPNNTTTQQPRRGE
jgi:hypothetical protein